VAAAKKGGLMGRVIRTPRAKQDILRIARYIAKDNMDAALRFFDIVEEKIELLSRFPGAGPVREDLGKDLRSFPFWSYLIIYRRIDDGIEIVTLAHGSQDLPRVLKDLE
jgi:toxin ParE1/3/4